MDSSIVWRRLPALVAGAAFLILAAPPVASAVPPPNDSFANAHEIMAFPFSDSVNNFEATTEPGFEPQFCWFMPQTVWYVIRPARDALLRVSMARSNLSQTNFNVYRGTSIFGLSFLNCASFGSTLSFTAQAGDTYYIQAGSIFGLAGTLRLDVEEILPPPNDDFAAAKPISTLPFSDRADTTVATTEPNEPTLSCAFGGMTGSVWYSFTPATSISVSARSSAPFSTALGVYTGSSLEGLNELKCRNFSGLTTFRAEAGTTYYVQAGGMFGSRGPLDFRLTVAPDPVAALSFGPQDPSMFEEVNFFNGSFDPGEVGIESASWDFGDGSVATGCCPAHRYAVDGDYTSRLTVTTFDGRTASVDQPVHVQTHDVTAMRFVTPSSATSGRTKQLSVDVRNTRYDERVEVQLLKSVPNGFELVGVLTQFVPVRETGRAVEFSFNYTFTAEDASVGKVTFKAVATIVNARDALPADNEAIASPTKVNR